MSAEYLATVARLEPDIVPVDRDGALTSIAISLKRIADTLEGKSTSGGNDIVETLFGIMMNTRR